MKTFKNPNRKLQLTNDNLIQKYLLKAMQDLTDEQQSTISGGKFKPF